MNPQDCTCEQVFRYSFYWKGEYRGDIYTNNLPLHDILASQIQQEGEVSEGIWVVIRESVDSKEHVAAIFKVDRSDKFTIKSVS